MSNGQVEAIMSQSIERAIAEVKAIHPEDGKTLDRLYSQLERARPMLAEIKAAVCEFYCIVPSDLASYSHEADLALFRQVFCYLARRYTRLSTSVIGQHIGNRDHSTVLHAVRKIEKLLAGKSLLADDIDLLRLRISEKVLLRCAAGRA